MGRNRDIFQELDEMAGFARKSVYESKKNIETADEDTKVLKMILEFVQSQSAKTLENFIQTHISQLLGEVEQEKTEIKKWEDIINLVVECQRAKDRERTKVNQSKLCLQWRQYPDHDGWFSEAGNVYKRGTKYNGFPVCWRGREPVNEDDKSYGHMVKRPSRGFLEQNSEMIDFDTLIDCQLAVEKAHFGTLDIKQATQNELVGVSR